MLPQTASLLLPDLPIQLEQQRRGHDLPLLIPHPLDSGVIYARSPEAAAGVQIGMSLYQAQQMFPIALVVEPDELAYHACHTAGQAARQAYSPLIETVGLGEFLVDVRGIARKQGSGGAGERRRPGGRVGRRGPGVQRPDRARGAGRRQVHRRPGRPPGPRPTASSSSPPARRPASSRRCPSASCPSRSAALRGQVSPGRCAKGKGAERFQARNRKWKGSGCIRPWRHNSRRSGAVGLKPRVWTTLAAGSARCEWGWGARSGAEGVDGRRADEVLEEGEDCGLAGAGEREQGGRGGHGRVRSLRLYPWP